jgi:RNA polymerase sigma factor (sigma-70 family)
VGSAIARFGSPAIAFSHPSALSLTDRRPNLFVRFISVRRYLKKGYGADGSEGHGPLEEMKRPDTDECAIAAPADTDLLRSYAATQSEESFSELVRRYANLVYSAAIRQTTNHATAEDVTQAVFTVLARKAPELSRETVLAGWLIRATRYAALDALKLEARRLRRERVAADLEEIMRETPETRWEEVAPLIDEALAALSMTERNAILLRYFQKQSWKEVGQTLGLNENAARVRVGRALEKLRSWFRKRRVTTSAAGLSAALLTNAVQAAPAGLMVNTSMANAALVTLLLKRLLWRKILPASVSLAVIAAALLGGWLLPTRGGTGRLAVVPPVAAPAQPVVPPEVRAVLNEVDRALFFNDPQAFVGQINFRTAEEERFRPLLAEYVRVSNEFRAALAEVHTAGRAPSRTYRVILDDLFTGQPGPGRVILTPTHAMDNAFRSHCLHIVKTNGTWKWDFFAPFSAEMVPQRMSAFASKIETMITLTSALREHTLTNAYEALHQFTLAVP